MSRQGTIARDRFGSLQRISNVSDESHTVYLSTGGYMEEFFERVDEILYKVDPVHSLVEELERNYSIIVSSSLKAERVFELKVEKQVDDIKRYLREANVLLKGIEVNIENTEETSKHTTTHRIKQMQHVYLSWYLNKTMAEFNSLQVGHQEKLKEMMKREIEITEQDFSDEQIDEMIENGNISMFTSDIIVETEKAKQDLELIVGRHNHILKIEKSITELHSMFMDLALLVESQGHMVDSIEHNVMQTQEYITKGGKNLKSARNYRDKARRAKFYCAGCCLILLIVVAIILLIKFA